MYECVYSVVLLVGLIDVEDSLPEKFQPDGQKSTGDSQREGGREERAKRELKEDENEGRKEGIREGLKERIRK